MKATPPPRPGDVWKHTSTPMGFFTTYYFITHNETHKALQVRPQTGPPYQVHVAYLVPYPAAQGRMRELMCNTTTAKGRLWTRIVFPGHYRTILHIITTGGRSKGGTK